MLADQDVEDDAVDGVVRAVPGDDPHLGLLLPEAIHPALALLVAGGVPGEVVVQDGIEVLLEVDAFGETVGAHEHEPAAAGGEPRDALLALGVRQPAGDRLHPNVLRDIGPALSCLQNRLALVLVQEELLAVVVGVGLADSEDAGTFPMEYPQLD